MALRFTSSLSSIFMDSTDSLGSEILNKKFRFLLDNDLIINESFANGIGIWQCTWYYDSSLRGYSIGDAVWLNTEDPLDFVKSHAATIKNYTDLNSSIINKLPDFDENNSEIISKYLAALSGYTDPNLGRNIVLPPIFDIGDFTKPIQIAISLKNNNKSLISDSSSWKKLFVDTDENEEEIRKTIDNKEAYVLSAHLSNYHLLGHEAAAEKLLTNYMDAPSINYVYTGLPSNYYYNYSETRNKPIYGADYVTYSIRKPYVLSGIVSQYQACRYWKSGMLEHFGTIATDNEFFFSGDKKDFVIPFNWQIADDDSEAKVFDSGELAKNSSTLLSALESYLHMIAPKDNLINVMYEKKNVLVHGLNSAVPFKTADYSITIHPIYQTQTGLDNSYLPINYGENEVDQNWNANYLTNELLNRKSNNYASMRMGTRVLPPYISYYAVGKGEL